MKQIKYGNRQKSKSNNLVEEIKDGENDICGDVLDTLNADYLSYISDLVKASKTPSKKRPKPEQKVNQLFQSPRNINNYTFQEEKSRNANHSPKTEKSFKNSTVPLKKLKNAYRNSQQIRKPNAQFFCQDQPNNQHIKTQNLKIHYNRFPTQQAERNSLQRKKFQETSIACEESPKYNTRRSQGENFINKIDEYLMNLESERNISRENKKGKRNHPIRDIEEVMQQNIKLRKKVYKYEEKIGQIQENLESHFIQCKNKEKSQKKKINELIKSLAQAVNKINEQKQQIDNMKDLFKMIGRKASNCVVHHGEQSSSEEMEEEINHTLLKAMKPQRSSSQNKMNRKKDLKGMLLQKGKIY